MERKAAVIVLEQKNQELSTDTGTLLMERYTEKAVRAKLSIDIEMMRKALEMARMKIKDLEATGAAGLTGNGNTIPQAAEQQQPEKTAPTVDVLGFSDIGKK